MDGFIKIDKEPILIDEVDVQKIMSEDFPEGKTNVYNPKIYSGGWGYNEENAVIITPTEFDKSFENVMSKAVEHEYAYVPMRLYEELIINRQKGDKFSGITWDFIEQKTVNINNHIFDVLIFNVEAFHEPAWNWLKNDYESNNYYENDEEGERKHLETRDYMKSTFQAEFWFDITQFNIK